VLTEGQAEQEADGVGVGLVGHLRLGAHHQG
jgi:hypothetical protein